MNAEIKSMSTAEMIAEYNELTGKTIKKFSSRAAGERQLAAARATAAEAAQAAHEIDGSWDDLSWDDRVALWHKEGRCPHCGADPSAITAAGKEGTTAGENRSFCHHCETEFENETGMGYSQARFAARAEAAKSSWQDAATRAARSARHRVIVNGVEYRSVKAAFDGLNLPLGKHIKFRAQLKSAGKLDFEFQGTIHKFKITTK